jgi:hypothetical protein
VRVIVILDVKPHEDEPSRTFEQIKEDLETEIEANTIDVANANGDGSAHEVKVLAVGKTWPEVQENLTAREQFNSARD